MPAFLAPRTGWVLCCLIAVGLIGMPDALAPAATGTLKLTVLDKDTRKPIACRMHLIGPKKRPYKPDKTPFWHDHFVLPGTIDLKLPLGTYSFVVERGLEYLQQEGYFTIEHFADDAKEIELRRFIDMAADGWWSGDLDIRRPAADIELLMAADDLHVGEVITWRNDKNPWGNHLPKQPLVHFDGNRYYHLLGGASTRLGTELLLFNLTAPLKLPTARSEEPPLVECLSAARANGDPWVDAAKPFSWDLPMLVAAGLIDSVEVAHGRICRDQTLNDEADGKPRDRQRYPSWKGSAEWSQEVYFRLLECGLRIPPTAGSGSGEAPNPVGYNRVYVHVDGELNYEQWWRQLRAGAVLVTNGPLMQVRVEGELPGHVFQVAVGGRLDLEIGLSFSTREPVSYLEIIQDGHVAHELRFDDYAKNGRLPKLSFDRSGWFLLRAVTNLPRTYRFAMTAPYYVEVGDQRRISKKAAQFFLDWVYERARQIKLPSAPRQQAVLKWHRQSRDFWQDLVAKANAE